MIAKKPDIIDFTALKNALQSVIHDIQKYLNNINPEIIRLEKLTYRTFKEENDLVWLKIEQNKLNNQLQAKQNLLNEYSFICDNYQLSIEADYKDYTENFKKVRTQAFVCLASDKVPFHLRNHLKQVVKQSISGFSTDQKVAYYLALKKEVEVCKKYLDS